MPSDKISLFFSGYGSFIHELLASYYRGERTREDIVAEYLTGFRSHVMGRAPDQKIFSNYFQQGLSHLKGITKPSQQIIGVENEVSFQVGGYPFVGYIDLLLRNEENGDITILDHKSRNLKRRSMRAKPTKTDEELDRYLRQLYLYSIPVKDTYKVFPSYLMFNCYRTGAVIREPFSVSAFNAAVDWAAQSVDAIIHTDDFHPCMDYYFCRYICDVHDRCEYYAIQG